jgi:hypothetical protein
MWAPFIDARGITVFGTFAWNAQVAGDEVAAPGISISATSSEIASKSKHQSSSK